MFRIRKAQADAYALHLQEEFIERALAHLRKNFPGPTADYGDEILRQRVKQCIERCAPYGLTTQQQIICFVDATFLLGEQFDKDPQYKWPGPLLNDAELAPADKAAQLFERAYAVYEERHSGR